VLTLTSYDARTRSELISVAQIIAFGLSSLDALSEATAADLSPSMKTRLRGCANGLNRAAQQNRKALGLRPAGDPPGIEEPAADPISDIPEQDVQAAMRPAGASIDDCRNRLSGVRTSSGVHAVPVTKEERNKRLWGGAMIQVLADMGMPVGPAPA
jgi:hypothetical protein